MIQNRKTYSACIMALLIMQIGMFDTNAQSSFHASTNVVSFSNSASEYVFYNFIEIFNDSGLDLNLRWVRVEENIPPEWETRVIDIQDIHPPDQDSAEFVLTALPTFNDKMIVNFFPANTPGYGQVRLKIYNILDPSDKINLLWNATAYPGNDTISTSVALHTQDELPFSLYPNPSSGIISISMNSFEAQEYELRIIDLAGKCVHISKIHPGENHTHIDVSKFGKGVYQAILYRRGKSFPVSSSRFIIE